MIQHVLPTKNTLLQENQKFNEYMHDCSQPWVKEHSSFALVCNLPPIFQQIYQYTFELPFRPTYDIIDLSEELEQIRIKHSTCLFEQFDWIVMKYLVVFNEVLNFYWLNDPSKEHLISLWYPWIKFQELVLWQFSVLSVFLKDR